MLSEVWTLFYACRYLYFVSRDQKEVVQLYFTIFQSSASALKKLHCRPFNTPQNLMEGYPRSLLGWLAKGLFLLFLLQLVISRPCKSFLFLDFLCVKKTWHFLLICENKNDRFDWDGRTKWCWWLFVRPGSENLSIFCLNQSEMEPHTD